MPITQPKNNVLGYEKYFSNELNNFIENTIHSVVVDINVNSITPPVFFSGILTDEECMAYKVLNGYLTTYEIDNIFKKIYTKAMEQATLSILKPGTLVEFSPAVKVLFSLANNERIALKHDTIATDHVLLALLNPDTKGSEDVRNIFTEASVSYDIIKENCIKMHEVADTLNRNLPINLGGKTAISFDKGDPDGDYTTVTLYAPLDASMNPNEVIQKVANTLKGTFNPAPKAKKSGSSIPYCVSLNDLAASGKIDPLIGRRNEVKKIIKIFNRRKRNNAILVGESGVGKSAIVEGLAKMIVDGEVPESIKDYSIYLFNPMELLAGTQFRGMFEDRMNGVIKELKARRNAILFIDNIHNILGNQNKNEYDFGGILTESLKDNAIKVIATTSQKGYHSAIENNAEMAGCFQSVKIEKPSMEECVNIIKNVKPLYEKFHGVTYSDEAVDACIKLADRYVTERPLPMSAIDLLDEAGSEIKLIANESPEIYKKRKKISEIEKEKIDALKKDDTETVKTLQYEIDAERIEIAKLIDAQKSTVAIVTAEDMYQTVSEHTNIPVQKLNVSDKKAISGMADILKKNIIGQDEAINVVCQAIKRSKVGLYPSNRPIFSSLCIGNTGCGKTLLAKMLAKEIFGDEKYLVRFDMSEYSDKTAVNKLIGASAGYVGYNEGGLLTEAVKNKKHAVVLIDEIEKATDEIYNLFLQILDEGCLTDNTGQKVDFKNTILILTSNVGAKRAQSENGIGFDVDDNQNKKDIIEKELKNKFPPEFINRLDEIVYFNQLSDDNLKEIVKLEINKLDNRMKAIGHHVTYTDDVVEYIFNICEKDKKYGARPIARAIQREIENKITDMLLETEKENITFNAKIKDNELKIEY
jgi:ATP-dependent Clp protease ATP-binding subunit ClpC